MDEIRLANGRTVTLCRGDITTFPADAIVNAANAYLASGGGVSGAIHAAAGPGLKAECDALALEHGPLRTGEAVVTRGHALPAAHVVHALGPVWSGGNADEARLLDLAYRNAVAAADEAGARSVALPSISTGIFGYPLELAAPIALKAVADAVLGASTVSEAIFVLYDDKTYAAFLEALRDFSA